MHSTSSRPIVLLSCSTRRADGAPERARLNTAYLRAVERAGLVPLVIPPSPTPALAAAALQVAHGLLLTGGEDVDPARYGAVPHPALGPLHPERDETEASLLHAARAHGIPTLAICRGIQLANVALGGTLVQDLPSERPGPIRHDADARRTSRVHAVSVDAGSRLASALGATALSVNSMHHQALDRVASALRVVATAPDGVVEGIESADPSWWLLGAQWHPEELTEDPDPWDRGLFAAFAAAAEGRKAGPGSGS